MHRRIVKASHVFQAGLSVLFSKELFFHECVQTNLQVVLYVDEPEKRFNGQTTRSNI